LLCKEKPISIKYGLNNPEFDSEGRIIAAEFSEFFLINVCKLYFIISILYLICCNQI